MLARAVLRRTRILYIDEATANIDAEHHAVIQRGIRTVFVDSTFITVAHRLPQ